MLALAVGVSFAHGQDSRNPAPKPQAGQKPKPAQPARPAQPQKPAAQERVPPAATQPAGPATASKANAPIRDAYAAMPLAERRALQSDLIWSGDYNGVVNGEFNDRAIAAVKAFQKRSKNPETGILSPQERAALAAAVKEQQEQVGWKIVEDHVMTGIWLGIPARLIARQERGRTGARWTSGRGEIQIETFRENADEVPFAASFELQKKIPAGRKTEYSVLRPDFYVVSGLQGLKKFYVRAHIRDSEVRGMIVLYDQAMEGIMEPVVVAMSSAFAPFDGASAMPGLKRFVEYATAVPVSRSGHLLTDRMATESCHLIIVPGIGRAERIADDKETDLALIRVHGAKEMRPLPLSVQPPHSAELTLVGIGDPQMQGGGAGASTAAAQIRGLDGGSVILDPPPPSGFSGAAVLDAQGQFVGLAGLQTANRATLVSAASARKFLEFHKVAPAIGSASLADARASVSRLICVRK